MKVEWNYTGMWNGIILEWWSLGWNGIQQQHAADKDTNRKMEHPKTVASSSCAYEYQVS